MIEVISIAELIELVSHVLLFIKKLNNVRKKYKEIDKRFERLKEDVAQLQLLLEDVGELSEEELLQNETISVRALSSATQHCGDDLQRLISRLEAANTKNMKRFKKFSRKTALSLDDDFFADIEKDVSKHRVDIAAALSLANMYVGPVDLVERADKSKADQLSNAARFEHSQCDTHGHEQQAGSALKNGCSALSHR